MRSQRSSRVLQRESFPALKLRGYGTLSGEFARVKSGESDASVLWITCESPDAARLLTNELSKPAYAPGVTRRGQLRNEHMWRRD